MQPWFLAALNRRAHVHLIDKEYFLVTRIVDYFLAEPSYAAGTRLTQDQRATALALYRARNSGGRDWGALLAAFVELVRTKGRSQPDRAVVDRFFRARDSLARGGLGAQAEAVLDELSRTRVREVLSDMEGVSPLAGLVTVDSRDDPRVQVADLLAGLARRSPAAGDDGPLRPFLSPTSLRDPQATTNR